jgi:hypothetical protein
MKNSLPDDAEVLEFWKGVAEKRGGEAEHRSFGLYLGNSGKPARGEVSGLIYAAGGKLWFETVESQRLFMGFSIPGALKKEKYEYFELGIPLEDISGAVLVGSGDANACMRGAGRGQDLKPIGFFSGFFDRPVLQVRLRTGISEFFEVDRAKELAAALRARPSP